MTKQEMFDKAVTGIAKQGGPARVGHLCQYRAGTRKCAVGHLISDKLYRKGMEGMAVEDLLVYRSRFGLPRYFLREVDFLVELQNAHDRSYTLREARGRFTLVARSFGLKADAVSKLKSWKRAKQ